MEENRLAHLRALTIKPRRNNPPGRVKDWVALRDSYSTGPDNGSEKRARQLPNLRESYGIHKKKRVTSSL
jgi:hypothetical protein